MELTDVKLTSDSVCCPECGNRAPYTAKGRTDWHLDGDAVCLDVWPPFVVGAPVPPPPTRTERRAHDRGKCWAPTCRLCKREAVGK